MIEKITNPFQGRRTVLSWHLGNTCTYACSYCPARYHDGSLGWPVYEDAVELIKQMHAFHVQKLQRQIFINFSGGEPTLYPKLTEFCQAVTQISPTTHLNIISNGRRTTRWWNTILPYIGSVILTYHVEYANIDDFVEVADILMDANKLDRIHFPMTIDRWDECVAANERLREIGLPVFTKPLFVDWEHNLYPYSADQLQYIRNNTTSAIQANVTRDGITQRESVQSLIVNKETNYYDWDCEVGLEHIVVKSDGRITRGECGVGTRLGNLHEIRTRPLRFDQHTVRCPQRHCSCIVDITLSKQPRFRVDTIKP